MSQQSLRRPDIARVDTGRGGLTRVVVSGEQADAEIYLHGAQVTHFQPRGHNNPLLFLSGRSFFEEDQAIRGGVPICFPWFGAHPTDARLPTHEICVVDDPTLQRKIVIDKHGSNSTVVWNPWAAKAKEMKDFDEAEWPTMLCVEAANVADAAITLRPGASHKMMTTIRAQ